MLTKTWAFFAVLVLITCWGDRGNARAAPRVVGMQGRSAAASAPAVHPAEMLRETGRIVMYTGSKAIIAGLAALALFAPVTGTTSASAANWGRHHYVYVHHYYRHYGWRHHRYYVWHRHYYYYGGAPVLGAIVGGLAAGLVAGPYYYGPPYPYYYGPGPYWW
jgi:hypothetical protein